MPSNTGMKTSRSAFLVGFVFMVAVVGFAYSLHTAMRVRALERRLQQAEAALQSQGQPAMDAATVARIRSLEERLQRAERTPAQAPSVSRSGPADTVGLEQRVQKIEQQIKPHLEVLPPYGPDR